VIFIIECYIDLVVDFLLPVGLCGVRSLGPYKGWRGKDEYRKYKDEFLHAEVFLPKLACKS
jgi:hypothetical protein